MKYKVTKLILLIIISLSAWQNVAWALRPPAMIEKLEDRLKREDAYIAVRTLSHGNYPSMNQETSLMFDFQSQMGYMSFRIECLLKYCSEDTAREVKEKALGSELKNAFETWRALDAKVRENNIEASECIEGLTQIEEAISECIKVLSNPMFKKAIEEEPEEYRPSNVPSILVALASCQKMVIDSIAFAKGEYGAIDEKDLTEDLSRFCKTRGIKLEAPNEPVWLRCNNYRLLKIIIDLSNNAVDFAPIGATVRFYYDDSTKEVVCIVSDDGQGISEENRRIDPVTDRPKVCNYGFTERPAGIRGGTGVGLAMLDRAVAIWKQHMGGGGYTLYSITEEEIKNQGLSRKPGTTFTVRLPAERVSAPPTPLPAVSNPTSGIEAQI